MQIVYTADNGAEAHIITHILKAEGIIAHIMGSHLQGAIGELPVSGFNKIMVPDEDAERARVIITEAQTNT